MQPSIARETLFDRRQPIIRWGAVFAGALVSVGLWVLLLTLGTGIGLAAINPNDEHSLRAAALGTTIWSLIAPLIALFLGGLIAGRFATTFSRGIGALHGLVVWGLAAVAGVLATVSVVSAIVGSAMAVTKAAAGPVASVAEKASSHLDTNDLLAPINEKLQQEGKPPVTADQIGDVTKSLAGQAMGGGEVDHQAVVDALTKNTQMSRADAEDVASRIEQRYHGMQQGMSQAGEQAKHAALTAADATGKALFWVGISLLVSLITAMLGGLAGVRRPRSEEERVVRTTPPASPTIVTEP